ncbi:MAG TPA: hypothetical protein VNV85_01710, partial [Puia sp.]|nr:hypothetical protein [Puia sp.]
RMIEEASKILGLKIISSSNNPYFKLAANEWRAPGADKAWQRLIDRGKAKYDSTQDIYVYLP